MLKSVGSMRILLVFGLLVAGVWGRSASHFPGHFNSDATYNEQNSLTPDGGYRGRENDWVKLSQKTGRVLRVPQGGKVELVCEASGSPSPSIQWVKGSRAITPFEPFYESNDIRGVGLGKVISRLVIDCALPHHQGTYTCTAVAGTKSDQTPSTALIVEGNGSNRMAVCEKENAGPRIQLTRTIALESSNNDVVLPCKVHGRPKPKVFWLNKDDDVIDSETDMRFKVLENGDLSILRIRWEDMGRYTCVAENKFGQDTSQTFLYPLSNEK